MPPGIIMIDDNWQEDYGKWNFHQGRFPDPHSMMKELKELGNVNLEVIIEFEEVN